MGAVVLVPGVNGGVHYCSRGGLIKSLELPPKTKSTRQKGDKDKRNARSISLVHSY